MGASANRKRGKHIKLVYHAAVLLYHPLEEAAGGIAGLVDLETDGGGFDGVELNRIGHTLLAGVTVGTRHRGPLAIGRLVEDAPSGRNLAASPWRIVEPIDGGTLDGVSLGEVIFNPLRTALLGPIMIVGHAAILGTLGNQAVVDGTKTSHHVRGLDDNDSKARCDPRDPWEPVGR